MSHKTILKYVILALYASKSSLLIIHMLLLLHLGICGIIYHAITIEFVIALAQALLLTIKRSIYEIICTRYQAE